MWWCEWMFFCCYVLQDHIPKSYMMSLALIWTENVSIKTNVVDDKLGQESKVLIKILRNHLIFPLRQWSLFAEFVATSDEMVCIQWTSYRFDRFVYCVTSRNDVVSYTNIDQLFVLFGWFSSFLSFFLSTYTDNDQAL